MRKAEDKEADRSRERARRCLPPGGRAQRSGAQRAAARLGVLLAWGAAVGAATHALASVPTPVPADQRGTHFAERSGTHDASNIRTVFWNYGMVGDYPPDPINVDLSVFHSAEVPKGSGLNYTDGITPFVLTKIDHGGTDAYVMETGYRERQGNSPYYNRDMRFEPRPGYIEPDPVENPSRSPAVSNDPRTWPAEWPDRLDDPDDPGWRGSWNGYFGKQIVADQESYTVMDDQYYDAWPLFHPDSRDPTRKGLGLRVEVRGFQWANPQARNVIFWHYDITNESTTEYSDVVFGLYMDSGVGGSAVSCDDIAESDDDNAYFQTEFNGAPINLVYTWDKNGHGRSLAGSCAKTGYLGYAYLETPGKPNDGVDNDRDGITDEKRDAGEGTLLTSQAAIDNYVDTHYNRELFEAEYGPVADRPAYRNSYWWTGDEDMDWTLQQDVGADGVKDTHDTGEGNGRPSPGEPNFDRTDLNESDQIGLTGFKFNRIRPGVGNDQQETDNILFFTTAENWPQRLYEQFTDPDPAVRFDNPLAANYNIGFLFASGPFTLSPGQTERFSLALAYGADITELGTTVRTVQQIYNANYRFAVPPPLPTVTAEAGDGYVRLAWSNVSETGSDPVTGEADFEGYRIYRATDPEFRDPQVIFTGTGSGPIGNGRPVAQFDLNNAYAGFSNQVVEGVAYYLGTNSGLTHTWTDKEVENGQLYYYAVCAYDHGSESPQFNFYPSESAIAVSRTLRGGLDLPPNVVAVRPNPRVAGYVPAGTQPLDHAAGRGVANIDLQVLSSEAVPNDHLFALTFETPHPDSLRATAYSLRDSTSHATVFVGGADFEGAGIGPTGAGLLPVITMPAKVSVDTSATGFTAGSPTDARFKTTYQLTLPINRIRPGFPDDITIRFADTVVDTSLEIPGFPGQPPIVPAKPAKFNVVAHASSGDLPLDFYFTDKNDDGTLDRADETIDIATPLPGQAGLPPVTWRVTLAGSTTPTRPPAGGDLYQLVLQRPLSADDVFAFTTKGSSIDPHKARANREFAPYVVPNPYVGSASFEPERFAVSGRGERRIEFRGLPSRCTIRVFTVRGDLVQTLRHDGSSDGFVAWDLRTKDNLDVAPGLYVFHVESDELGTATGKFAVVK